MIAPRIRTTLPFGLVLLTALLLSCASTGPPRFWIEPVATGDRVRVWAPSVGVEGAVGTVLALRADTIVVDNDEPLVLAISSLTRLEVSRDRQSRAGIGGIVGLIGGAVAGAVIGIASIDNPENECFSFECEHYEDYLKSIGIAAVLGGVVGYSVGFLIGSTIKVDRWEEVPLDRLQVTIMPQRRGGLSVGLSVKL